MSAGGAFTCWWGTCWVVHSCYCNICDPVPTSTDQHVILVVWNFCTLAILVTFRNVFNIKQRASIKCNVNKMLFDVDMGIQ